MLWLVLAFSAAVFHATSDAIIKFQSRSVSSLVLTFGICAFGGVLCIPLLLWFGFPELGEKFLYVLILTGFLDAIATASYVRAIALGELSLVAPLIAFTPIFLLAVEAFMLGEVPPIAGLVGIVVIVFGTYVLYIDRSKTGLLAPIASLLTNSGARLMLFVSFLWSVTTALHKLGVQESSPLCWSASALIVTAAFITVMMMKDRAKYTEQIKVNVGFLALLGLLCALTTIGQMTALSMSYASYVIAVKRLSIIFSVVFGVLIFKEGLGLKANRVFSAALLVIGVSLMVLF